jgi:drug/metabolite transporter (DMT)-like permease
MLENKKLLNILLVVLMLICIALLCVDFFYHKHGHFAFEETFGFFPAFGFLAFVALSLCAKLLRKVVKRREDYYD